MSRERSVCTRLLLALLAASALLPGPVGAAILNGRITDPGGFGVHPLDIDVRNNSTGVLLVTPDDTTNVNGDYSIVVPPGKYDITFVPTAASHLFQQTRTGVQVSNTTTTNRSLTAGRYVSGRVVDANGAGVPGVNLNFADAGTGAAAGQLQDDGTDGNGFFNTLAPSGVWNVDLAPTLVSRKVPREILGVNLSTSDQAIGTFSVLDGFLVTGTITDASFFPIAGADFDVRIAGTGSKLFTPNDNTSPAGAASFVIPAGLYDITGTPPAALTNATRTARAVVVAADLALPNLDLPPGVALSAHCVTTGGVPVPNVDCDADSLPLLHRLQTPHDVTNASGDVSVQVSLHKFKVNYAPPVASKLLPVVFDSLQITGARNMGNVVHATGHWVSVNVTEQFTGLPLQGVNLDFVDAATGKTLLTLDDVTNATGFARVVTDQRQFNLIVRGPGPSWSDLTFTGFRTLQDTTLALQLDYSSLGVGSPRLAALELAPPWPNPARGVVATAITSASSKELELTVWDVAGRKLATVFHGAVLGRRTLSWDARDERGVLLAPGLYLLQLTDGHTTSTRRVAVMR